MPLLGIHLGHKASTQPVLAVKYWPVNKRVCNVSLQIMDCQNSALHCMVAQSRIANFLLPVRLMP